MYICKHNCKTIYQYMYNVYQQNVCNSQKTYINTCTVKPVYTGRPRGITIVAFVDRWLLFGASETIFTIFTRQTKTGLYRQETTTRRCPYTQVWLYNVNQQNVCNSQKRYTNIMLLVYWNYTNPFNFPFDFIINCTYEKESLLSFKEKTTQR